MRRWLVRIGLWGAGLALAGFLVAASGIIPITASGGHWPITEWFLRFSMKRSIATHSLRVEVPPNLQDRSLVLKGATHYDVGCRACHGEPGMPRPRVAAAMLPPPPDLAPRIRESNPKRLFYAVKHGLKFTGMPAWPAPQRDDEVWAVVAFLLEYPVLSADEYRRMVQREAPAAEPLQGLHAPPRAVVQSCARCHGGDGLGRGVDAFPRLAGQRFEYLLNAMQAYTTRRRHSGIMGPVAAGLDPVTTRELAEYYAGLRTASVAQRAATPVDPEAIARGKEIALNGVRAQRIPACVECHGPGARRAKPEYPTLAGQHAGYLELQLTLFREGRRGGSEYAHLMERVAAKLTPEQARDVTRYFESLPAGGAAEP